MSKLVIFDGNAIMHRAYHALPPLTTKKGKPINAVYGLVSMLLRVISDLEPTHIAFAFDLPEPTFRKKLHAPYQGHRPEMDKDLGEQFKRAYKALEAFGIPIYTKSGYEADDVIGTIAKRAIQEKDPIALLQDDNSVGEVIIVTGDRDMLQLINSNTKLYMPGRGLSDSKLYGSKETKERMGVLPNKIVDLKGLIGDPSDNYKGVPGVGPKTAEKLLKEYGSFEGVYKNVGKLPERQKNLLITHKESADMSYKLARIVIDVPIKFSLGDAEKWKVDSKAVFELFDKYGFKTLSNRVKSVGRQVSSRNQQSLL